MDILVYIVMSLLLHSVGSVSKSSKGDMDNDTKQTPVRRIPAHDESELLTEYIVTLPQSVSISSLESQVSAQGIGASFLEEYKFGDFHGALVKCGKSNCTDNLKAMSGVLSVSPNRRVYALQGDTSECSQHDTGSQYWGLTRTSHRDNPDFYPTAAGYSHTLDGEGVNVYILDTGVYTGHSVFEGRAVHGFTAYGLSDQEGDNDQEGHGTHVAGLVAGSTCGTAKKANIIAVKVLDKNGSGYISWIIQGLQWIANHFTCRKSVMNLSLGLGGTHTEMESAVSALVEAGVTVVVAAGNEDDDACYTSPARMSDVITVGATNIDDGLTYFTNYGTCVDVLAPGQDLRSAAITSPSAETLMSGTSMASPLVAGVAALILSSHEDTLSPDDVRELLIEHMATTGRISNAPDYDTPDLLLYSSCDEEIPHLNTTIPSDCDPLNPPLPIPDNAANVLPFHQFLWVVFIIQAAI